MEMDSSTTNGTEEPSHKKPRIASSVGGPLPLPAIPRAAPKTVDQTKSSMVCGCKVSRDNLIHILSQPLPRLSPEQRDALHKANKFSMEQSIRMVLMKQTLVQQQQQAKSLQRHQALVLMCRIYIGSISFELREDTIKNSFIPFGPIKSISMSWDPVTQKYKGFAFLEYEMPEAAYLALEQMNGVMIGGRNIKVGRPSNMPQVTVMEEIMEEANVYNRIYVASVHQDLSENDIKSVFEAFGKIRMCMLTPSPTLGKHKGYGFIEYETSQSAQEAIASMNLFDLGGQYLRVGRAITPPGSFYGGLQAPTQMPTAAAVAAAAATAKIQAMDALTTNMGIVTNISAALTQQQQQQRVTASLGISGLSSAAFNTALGTIGSSVPGLSSASLICPLATPVTDLSACLGGLGTGMPVGGFQSMLGKLGGANLAVIGGGLPPGTNYASVASLNTATIGNIGSLGNIGSAASVSRLGPPGVIPPPTLLGASSASNSINTQQQQIYQQASMVSTMSSTTQSNSSMSMATSADNGNLSAASAAVTTAARIADSIHQEELQKKLLDDNEPQTLRQQENMSIKGQTARHLVMQKLMRKSESTVIILRNMVTIDDVDEVLQEEITEECSRYGNVEHVIIYQEKQSEDEDAEVVVKIFVEFQTVAEAEAAKESLNGRYFGGRLVSAKIYDKNLYDHNDLSG